MKYALRAALVILSVLAQPTVAQSPPLVPMASEVTISDGVGMSIPDVLIVLAPDDEAWTEHLKIVAAHIDRLTRGKHRLAFDDGNPTLVVAKDESLPAEGYSLDVTPQQIQVSANSLKGLAHATSTLLQLIAANPNALLKQLSIQDAPQLSYRNFLIDMGRNPHSFELLKETIDLLWFYKVDSVQLHLTDDQRFAFPSTAYPKLWDGKITLQQFRQLEDYAVARGVTIIPELEVPGHSAMLRNRYPDVFGKSGRDLASSEEALAGIKTLLDEMMDVFSSTPFIHVGGDEAGGVPEEFQRDLINKLHAYLKSKGRQTMVWEGPRPGKGKNKVNEEVIHLNWRTINYRADQMLKDGYRVVNAAWDPLYLVDHYPRINFTMTSPQHIYETLKLTRFKHVNPGIPTFAKPIEVQPSDRLIGFCMPWWEGRESNFLPQNVPRLIPFAEVAWSSAVQRDFDDFAARTQKTEAARKAAFYPVAIEAAELVVPQDGVFHNQLDVNLKNTNPASPGELRYTLDGKEPNASSMLSNETISLEETTTVRAALFRDGQQVGHGSRRNFKCVKPTRNLALGKPVTSTATSGSPFSVERITDGGTGNLDFYLGYPAEPKPISITIDLEATQAINRIVVHAYTVSNSFEKYSVEVSTDGKTFEQVGKRLEKPEKGQPLVEHRFDARDVRYVRINSNGNKGYVFDSFSKLVEVQVFKD